MTLYGENMLDLGIAFIIMTVFLGTIFFITYSISASKLRKKLEKEYGKNKQ